MISDLKIVLEKISNIFFTKRCEFCGEVIEFDKNVIATSIKVNISKLWHRIYIKIMSSVLF